mmetsp:Transcript_19012/g.34421  ORF Transcript_19012/g.34421 Transcript_19012/m.34421 type:complete len:279 (-) Transcript_19012:73-909(-)
MSELEKCRRPSGRLANQLRTIICEKGVLSRADGSASWAQEGTEVLAAVYGPIVSSIKVVEQMGEEIAEGGAFEVIWKPRSGVIDSSSLEAQEFIRSALAPLIPLSRFPRCTIRLVLQVVADGGSVLACAANAAIAALVDAGVLLEKMAAAVAIGVLRVNSTDCKASTKSEELLPKEVVTVFDPDTSEEDPSQCISVLSFLWSYHYDFTHSDDTATEPRTKGRLIISSGILANHCRGGPVDAEHFIAALDMSRVAVEYLAAFSRNALVKSLRTIQDAIL